MVPFCREENIALTPYSALAGGRLSKHPGETSQRLEQDSYAKGKYDGAADQDAPILAQVAALAQARGVSMTEISLAWLLTKVTSPAPQPLFALAFSVERPASFHGFFYLGTSVGFLFGRQHTGIGLSPSHLTKISRKYNQTLTDSPSFLW